MSINFSYSFIHSIEVSASAGLETVAYRWSWNPNSVLLAPVRSLDLSRQGGEQGWPEPASAGCAVPSSTARGGPLAGGRERRAQTGVAAHGRGSLPRSSRSRARAPAAPWGGCVPAPRLAWRGGKVFCHLPREGPSDQVAGTAAACLPAAGRRRVARLGSTWRAGGSGENRTRERFGWAAGVCSRSCGTRFPRHIRMARVPSEEPACSSYVFGKGALEGPFMSKSGFFTCLPAVIAMPDTAISPYHHSILVFFSFL